MGDKKRKDNKLSPSRTACHYVDLRSRLLEEKVLRDSRSYDVIRGWYSDDTFDKILSEKSKERNFLHRAALQNQIIEKRRVSRESDEARQRERKINEQTIDLVREEDIRNEERKRDIRERLRAEKEATFKARNLWRDMRREAIREENKKIAEIVVEKEVEFKRLTEKKVNFVVRRRRERERERNNNNEKEKTRSRRVEIKGLFFFPPFVPSFFSFPFSFSFVTERHQCHERSDDGENSEEDVGRREQDEGEGGHLQ